MTTRSLRVAGPMRARPATRRPPPGRARLVIGIAALASACGEPPVEVARGEPVALGDYALTVRRTESVPLTEDEMGLVVHVDLIVHDPRAPGQVHGRGFASLASDPYHEHREQTFRQGTEVLDGEGNAYPATGYVRDEIYRREMARGSRIETFRRLAHEEYPSGYWEGESTERWVLLFIVPALPRDYALEISNQDRREGQPGEAIVPLTMRPAGHLGDSDDLVVHHRGPTLSFRLHPEYGVEVNERG